MEHTIVMPVPAGVDEEFRLVPGCSDECAQALGTTLPVIVKVRVYDAAARKYEAYPSLGGLILDELNPFHALWGNAAVYEMRSELERQLDEVGAFSSRAAA